MPQAVLEKKADRPVIRRVKISSKRQITIPVDVYQKYGFAEYAILAETDNGLEIRPFKLVDDDEEATLAILRYLMDRGYEGDALLKKYQEVKPLFMDYRHAIASSEDDIAAGRVSPAGEVQQRMREKYAM